MAERTSGRGSKAKSGKKAGKYRGKERPTAKTADRHALYQRAVQDAPEEVRFFLRTFRKTVGREPISVREDFCGTALFSAEWVQSDKRGERRATGVDFDDEVLSWGRRHNLAPLGEAAERVRLLKEDVRVSRGESYDLVAALNFSYWTFRTRTEMVNYFQLVRRDLADDGLFVLDAYGGWEGQEIKLEDPRPIGQGVRYFWHQAKFDPIDHSVENHIHFHFADGTKLQKAFSYFWRYWSLPELRELLVEAGFGAPTVYWCEEDGSYKARKRVQNQPGWLVYLVAPRNPPAV